MEERDPVTEALDFLESQGFYIRNLWHVQDVQNHFNCTDEEALDLLDQAVSGEWIIELINGRILNFGVDNNLDEK